jgi:hypothetical protein
MPKIYGNKALSNTVTVAATPLMTCPFNELRVTNRTPILDLKSTFTTSALRDNVITTSGGTVVDSTTTNTGEYMLATTTTVGSQAGLQSNERGSYQGSFGLETMIGIRFASATIPAGVQAKWGAWDLTNGYYFQYDSVNKLSCNIMRNSAVTQIIQTAFNIDRLDGTGPSGVTLDVTRGLMYQITLSWFGYGAIIFSILTTDANANSLIVPCHQYTLAGAASTQSPHQPIRVDLTNVSGNTAATGLYIAGRQIVMLGTFIPTKRLTGCSVAAKNYTTTITSIIAFRKKAGYLGFKCLFSGIDVNTPVVSFLYVNTQCTVTAGAWGPPPNTLTTETALEINTTFTGSTRGTQVYAAISSPYTNVGTPFDPIAMTDNDIMIFSILGIAGSGTQALGGVICRVQELW